MYHKGMSGWVEYHPGTKSWSYKLKWIITTEHQEGAATEAEAVLELKRTIDILMQNATTMRSVD